MYIVTTIIKLTIKSNYKMDYDPGGGGEEQSGGNEGRLYLWEAGRMLFVDLIEKEPRVSQSTEKKCRDMEGRSSFAFLGLGGLMKEKLRSSRLGGMRRDGTSAEATNGDLGV